MYDSALLITALLAVTAGAALQSMAGFGLAVVAAPILVLINPALLPVPILALGCILSLLNCIRYRQQLHFTNIRIALLARIPGSIIGVVLLTLLPSAFFSISFSLLIMLSVLLTYQHINITHSLRNLAWAGFFSGLMGTTTSVGGPPIALAYQNSALGIARAELSLYFLMGTLMSLVLLYLSGNTNYYQLQLTLPLIPAVCMGFGLSLLLNKYFTQAYLKPLIAILSVSSCCLILFKTISNL